MNIFSFGKLERDQLLLARLICIGLVALFTLCVAITSKILQERFDGHCILYGSASEEEKYSYLLQSTGNPSTCQYINVVSELILITCPFLVIFLFVERNLEAHHPSAVLARRTINLFTVIYTLLVLIQACISSVGFQKLCKSMIDDGATSCAQNLRYYMTEHPCSNDVECQNSRQREVEFHSILVALECLSWMLFVIFLIFTAVNAVTVQARASKFQFHAKENTKPLENGNTLSNTSNPSNDIPPKKEDTVERDTQSTVIATPKVKLRKAPPKPTVDDSSESNPQSLDIPASQSIATTVSDHPDSESEI